MHTKANLKIHNLLWVPITVLCSHQEGHLLALIVSLMPEANQGIVPRKLLLSSRLTHSDPSIMCKAMVRSISLYNSTDARTLHYHIHKVLSR